MKTITEQQKKKIAKLVKNRDIDALFDMGFYIISFWKDEVVLQGDAHNLGFHAGLFDSIKGKTEFRKTIIDSFIRIVSVGTIEQKKPEDAT